MKRNDEKTHLLPFQNLYAVCSQTVGSSSVLIKLPSVFCKFDLTRIVQHHIPAKWYLAACCDNF